ncbi:hypothetical protein CZP2022_219 [Vibrio phage C-ZP2022]|nr:hypothetical protein CZP2022_219 [Vibrio phage C-ZP2022]
MEMFFDPLHVLTNLDLTVLGSLIAIIFGWTAYDKGIDTYDSKLLAEFTEFHRELVDSEMLIDYAKQGKLSDWTMFVYSLAAARNLDENRYFRRWYLNRGYRKLFDDLPEESIHLAL